MLLALARRLRIVVSLGMLAVATTVPAATLATEPVPHVTLVLARHEAPGGWAHGIVTLWDAPDGYEAELTVVGTDGPTASCPGPSWRNEAARSVSRVCYVELPLTLATYSVVGRATLTRDGFQTLVVESQPKSITAKGAASPEPMTLEQIRRIDRCGNPTDHVWLTFDDSLNGWKVPTVMDILRRNDVRGRFFLTGEWLEEHPQNMLLITDHGHLAANHSYSHPALSTAPDEEVLRQIDKGVPATTDPKLLRPPYGLGAYTTRLADLAATRDYELCRWTVDTYDWDNESVSTMIDRVSVGDYRSPPIESGGVILMHGHGEHMIEALQGIIDAVRAKGLTLDPLGPTLTVHRPDASIAQVETGPYGMDDFYHHVVWPGQTQRRVGVAKGTTHLYFVRMQNDGNAVDDLTIRSTESGSARIRVTYLFQGADITGAVRGGGFVVDGLAPGATAQVVVRVRVGARAPAGSVKRSVLTLSTSAAPGRIDVVRAITKR